MPEVVLATHSAHKVAEFQQIFSERMPHLTIRAYDGPEPVEDGISFAENALIKARSASEHTGLVALADDSGICVDVMGGSPGILSARWSGTRDSVRNLNLLLAQLADIPEKHRAARFRCAIAVVRGKPGSTDYVARVVEGEWPGRILTAPSGSGGFGYDPIFAPDGYAVSVADLPQPVKNSHSHRARAFAGAIPIVAAMFAE